MLQVVVSKLRRALQPAAKDDASHLVVTAAAGYSLRIDPEAVDAVRFERLAADGRRLLTDGNANVAAAVLRDALALWRGPALMDFVNDDFAQGERTRLEELKASTLELRIEADLALAATNHSSPSSSRSSRRTRCANGSAGSRCSPSTGQAARSTPCVPIKQRGPFSAKRWE